MVDILDDRSKNAEIIASYASKLFDEQCGFSGNELSYCLRTENECTQMAYSEKNY